MTDPYFGAYPWSNAARRALLLRAKSRRRYIRRPHPVRTPAGLQKWSTSRYMPNERLAPGSVPPVTAPGPQPTDMEAQPETDAIAAASAGTVMMPAQGVPTLVWVLGGAVLLLGVAYAYSAQKRPQVRSNPRRRYSRGR